MVPVSVSTASSPTKSVKTFVLDEREAKIQVDNVKPNEWIKVLFKYLWILGFVGNFTNSEIILMRTVKGL